MAPKLKKGIKSIAGETHPQTGTTYTYEVTAFRDGSQNVAGESINWVVYMAERSGAWKRLPGLKKGLNAEFTFNQVAYGHTFLIEAYLYHPEMESPPGIIVHVHQGEPQIVKAEILDVTGQAISGKGYYGQTLTLQVSTENMFGQEMEMELWEADWDKGKPWDLDDPLWRNNKVIVDRKCGVISRLFNFSPSFRQNGNIWEEDWEQEIYLLIRSGTEEVRSAILVVSLKGIKIEKIQPGNGVVLVEVDTPSQNAQKEEEAAEQQDTSANTTCFCLEQGRTEISCKGKGLLISKDAYKQEADRLGIEVAVIKAIARQESKKSSFWEPGQATILYERHVMWDQLAADLKLSTKELKQLQTDDPYLVNKNSGGYGTYTRQYIKLKKAKKVDYGCAVKSCSWGKFQVMGYHYPIAFKSAEEMEQAVNTCELQQLYFFIAYLEKTPGLIQAMKEKNWEKIAAKYNGKFWKEHNKDYASNIEKYYHEYRH